MQDGSLVKRPELCRKCGHPKCMEGSGRELRVCPLGYHCQRASADIVVAGVVIRDRPVVSVAQSKRVREKQNVISKAELDSAILAVATIRGSVSRWVEQEKTRIIERYVESDQYKHDFLDELRPEIQKGLSFLHDYKQINAQIGQNINFVIESKYEGADLEAKLNQATHEEKAIYVASKLLDEKLNVAKFLLHPQWLSVVSECCKTRFHGAVIKYLRIYALALDRKKIEVTAEGSSYNEIEANPQAISVIPHTFLDNALKYSPDLGRINISLRDLADGGVHFAVSSYGPRILQQERRKIFEPFYRGELARKAQEEGAGYGLYVSQMIATDHLGTTIRVEQATTETKMGYWTTFSVELPPRAKIL